MRILSIIMITSMFSSGFAGELPLDFKFKSASHERTSLISQLKKYHENKNNAEGDIQSQALLSDTSSTSEVQDNDGIQEHVHDAMNQVRQFVTRVIAYFSVKKA